MVEIIIYVAVFGIVMGVLFNMIAYIYGMNKKITSYTNVTSNASSAMERISYEIANAENVYLATSNFENYNYVSGKSGQLSLATGKYPTANDETIFEDFYAENGTLFLKMDGENPAPLTSNNVSVTSFLLDYFKNGARESVRINMIVQSASDPEVSVNLINTIALRQ